MLQLKRARAIFLFAIMLGLPAWTDAARASACITPLMAGETLPGHLAETLDLTSLGSFYAGSSAACVWSAKSAAALLAVLFKADQHGLNPQNFHSYELVGPTAVKDQGLRDLLLTDAALRYARMMQNGRIELETIENDIDFPRPITNPEAGLRAALAQDNVSGWLQAQAPGQKEYKRLVEAFARYRQLAANGGWNLVATPEKSLKPGETSLLVPQLRQRLLIEGDLAQAEAQSTGDLYEGALVDALKHFQARHGLEADGVLGKKTLAELNISAGERANQIAINLERWRILSAALEPTRFEVNVAAATGTLFVAGHPALQMHTIVGAKKTPTPMLHSAIYMVVVNPPWVVPKSILTKEIMPLLQREPGYLQKHNMHWEDNQLVQAPGEKNSLGRIKFEMFSRFGVFLHDTPARSLFAKDERARSHGCIRLEKPREFAEYLLRNDPSWPRARIEQAIVEGATQRIPLPLAEKMPVAVVYWTSFVNESGVVEFRDDIYGRDARLALALTQRNPSPRVASAEHSGIGCQS